MAESNLQQHVKRWRLMLGDAVEKQAETCGGAGLDREQSLMDEALAALYDNTDAPFSYNPDGGSNSSRGAGKGKSAPKVARWLADIRTFFKEDVVSVIQADAIEKKGLKQLLFEPETLKSVKPDIEIVSTLISLKGQIPEQTKETARQVVKAVVDEINKRMESSIRRAVTGALNKKSHSPIPSAVSIDWKTTLRKNVKNYNKQLATIIPERFYFFDRSQKMNKWTVIVDMDQSGSMADSIVYGTVVGCILTGMSSLRTHVVAFDTEVVDLTDRYGSDPVDMLFGIQLGGGTDINKSVAYCEQFITEPDRTLFILLSDLYEGGNLSQLYARVENMVDSGVKVLALLALNDSGRPIYDERVARKLSAMGVPAFASTPNMLPEMIEGAIKGHNLMELAKRLSGQKKKK